MQNEIIKTLIHFYGTIMIFGFIALLNKGDNDIWSYSAYIVLGTFLIVDIFQYIRLERKTNNE